MQDQRYWSCQVCADLAQVAALCRLPSGGVPATYLNSQQSAADTKSVYHELRKVRPQLMALTQCLRTHSVKRMQ